jgi:L-serine dehydratase
MSERLSVFDMFKVSVGPSSSHTLGPWRAALAFVADPDASHDLGHVVSLRVDLYGALARDRAWARNRPGRAAACSGSIPKL